MSEINIGTIGGLTATEYLDEMVKRGIGIQSSGEGDIVITEKTLGSTLIMAGQVWRIVHIDGDKYYLATEYCPDNGTVSTTSAWKSALKYEQSLPMAIRNRLIPIDIPDFSARLIWIPPINWISANEPTTEMGSISSGKGLFDYFASDASRKYYTNEAYSATGAWMTSSRSITGQTWHITTNGSPYYDTPSNIYMRYFCCTKL